MAIAVTNILNDAKNVNYSYNAASNLDVGMVFFGRTHNYAGSTAAPKINGVDMTLLQSVDMSYDYFFYYAVITSAGSYTLTDGNSYAKQIFHVSEVNTINNSWSVQSKTLAVSGSGSGIMIDSVWSQGSSTDGYFTTQPAGYTEVADDRSIGSGADWGMGIEYSYKLAETGNSLVITSTATEHGHIAFELSGGGSSGPAGAKKVSGVASASIKKISGLAIASIKKISGVG